MRTTIGAAVAALTLTGCVSIDPIPDAVRLDAVHISTPFRGSGPAPIGDNGDSKETNYEGIEGALIWRRGNWVGETSLTGIVHSSNLDAKDGFIFTLRVGREWGLK